MIDIASLSRRDAYSLGLQLLSLLTVFCFVCFALTTGSVRFQAIKYVFLTSLVTWILVIKNESGYSGRWVFKSFAFVSMIAWMYLFSLADIFQRILRETKEFNSFSLYVFEGWLEISIDYYWNHIAITIMLACITIYVLSISKDLRQNVNFVLLAAGTNVAMGLMLFIFQKINYFYQEVF